MQIQHTGPGLLPFGIGKQDALLLELSTLITAQGGAAYLNITGVTEQAAAFPAGAGNVTVTMVAQHDTKSVDMAQVRSGPHPSCLSNVTAAHGSWTYLWDAVSCLVGGHRARLQVRTAQFAASALLHQHGAEALLRSACQREVCSNLHTPFCCLQLGIWLWHQIGTACSTSAPSIVDLDRLRTQRVATGPSQVLPNGVLVTHMVLGCRCWKSPSLLLHLSSGRS